MKKLFIKLLFILLPALLILCSVNIIVDPANVFRSEEYTSGLANILSNGHNADRISNYDERLMQVQMVKRLQQTPDIAILGSSRVWEMGSDLFPGKRILNFGVSSGTINDLLGVVGLLDSMHRLSKKIIISVDPFLVGRESFTEWTSLYPYHHYLFMHLNKINGREYIEERPDFYTKFTTLFSFEYFRSTIDFLRKGKTKKYIDVGSNKPVDYGRYSDGSVSYPASFTKPNVKLKSIIAKDEGLRLGIPDPDTARLSVLEAMLDYLKLKNVSITIIMMPYHPEYYNAVEEHQSKLFSKYMQFFTSIAAAKNIPLIGDFDASRMGVPREAFYDIYHCNIEFVREYLEEKGINK